MMLDAEVAEICFVMALLKIVFPAAAGSRAKSSAAQSFILLSRVLQQVDSSRLYCLLRLNLLGL